MKFTPEYECIIQVLATANTLWLKSRRFFKPFGISEAQFNILHLLGQSPKGMSQRELSDLLVVDRSNVTLLLDRMEKGGWIQRQSVPGDRRRHRVRLTSSGEKLWKKILPGYLATVQTLLAKKSPVEITACTRLLQSIQKTAEALEIG